MITLEEARSLVEAEITDGDRPGPDGAIVLDEATLERPWGWVFFYESRRFYETGDDSYCLLGNAPLIVERRSGRVLTTGTAQSIEFYLENYEMTGDPHLQLGPEIELSGATRDADRSTAARLLSRACSISIGDAKRGVDAVLRSTVFQARARTPDEACEVCTKLGELGFTARQLPEPA